VGATLASSPEPMLVAGKRGAPKAPRPVANRVSEASLTPRGGGPG